MRQELEGDKAAEIYVFGFVDDSHPATAELLDDTVCEMVWPIIGLKY
jgi:hypothetical protein